MVSISGNDQQSGGIRMTETFAVGSFRSRQQVIRFQQHLRRKGILCGTTSTPREIAVGCGLSVRFAPEMMSAVIHEYHQLRPTNLIGFYLVERVGSRNTLRAVPVDPIY